MNYVQIEKNILLMPFNKIFNFRIFISIKTFEVITVDEIEWAKILIILVKMIGAQWD